MMEYTSFIDDIEKMNDFKILTKEEFLASYSYLSEEEYDLTMQEYNKTKYSVKVIGIKNADIEKIKDFVKFEQNWIGKKRKVLLLHYLLTAFGGNSEEIAKLEKRGFEVYTIEPQDIGGESDVHFKEACKEFNYKIAV